MKPKLSKTELKFQSKYAQDKVAKASTVKNALKKGDGTLVGLPQGNGETQWLYDKMSTYQKFGKALDDLFSGGFPELPVETTPDQVSEVAQEVLDVSPVDVLKAAEQAQMTAAGQSMKADLYNAFKSEVLKQFPDFPPVLSDLLAGGTFGLPDQETVSQMSVLQPYSPEPLIEKPLIGSSYTIVGPADHGIPPDAALLTVWPPAEPSSAVPEKKVVWDPTVQKVQKVQKVLPPDWLKTIPLKPVPPIVNQSLKMKVSPSASMKSWLFSAEFRLDLPVPQHVLAEGRVETAVFLGQQIEKFLVDVVMPQILDQLFAKSDKDGKF